jgi:rod shape-determining protein MreD
MGPLSLRALGAAALAAFGWAAVAIELAPSVPRPAPDLLFCVVALWAIRRPAAAPLILAFLLGLGRDLVSGAPAGLGALALTLSAAALRSAGATLRRRNVIVEWAAVVAVAAAALLGQRLLLALTLAPAPGLGDLASRLAATALAWPVVVLALRLPARIGPAPATAEGGLMFERRAP